MKYSLTGCEVTNCEKLSSLFICLFLIAVPAIAGDSTLTASESPPESRASGVGNLYSTSDEALRARVLAALLADPEIYAKHIEITVERSVVTMDGVLSDESDLREAKRVVYSIEGVAGVNDQIEISNGGNVGSAER